MSAFAPDSYEEAKSTFKPLQRSRIRSVSPKQALSGKTSPAGRIPRRKPVRKKVKKPKVTTLKNKAWAQFSIFIRTEGADENGFNKCITCDVRKFWKDLQAGHFIRGRLNANLFDERGVWPQCYSCNVGAQGNVVLYYKVMLKKFGQEVIDELILQNNQTRKWLPGELQSIFQKYKALNDANPLVEEAV